MRKSRRGGENVDTAMETLAEQALAAMESARNGSGAEHGEEAAASSKAPEELSDLSEIYLDSGGERTDEKADAIEEGREAPAPDEDAALKTILEALLFVSPEPLSVERCASVVGQVSKAEVREALALLEHQYLRRGALQLVQVAGGYRIVTKPQFASWIRRLEKAKAQGKLSRSAVEALAIIAYRQPVVRGELEKIRGVETSGVIRTLLERKLVRIVGRKDEPGRPIMYGTTKQFLEHFGLRDLSELPPLREFKELGDGDQASLLDESEGEHRDDAAETAQDEGVASAREAEDGQPSMNGHHAGDEGEDRRDQTLVSTPELA